MKYDFPKTVKGFYWLVIKKFPIYFGAIFLCGILGNVLNMVFDPLAMKWITQIFENAVSADWANVVNLFILLAIMYFIPVMLNAARDILHRAYQQHFNRYKLYLLYKRVYENDISFFIDFPAGEISSQVMEISGRLNELMETFWVDIIGTVIGFVFIVGAMFSMNIWFVVILLVYGAFKMIWEWGIQRKIKVNQEAQVEEQSKYAGLRSDSINNALVVKYFANTEYENKYIYNGRQKLIHLIQRAYSLSLTQWLPTGILWRVTRLIILVMCFFMIQSGKFGISDAMFVVMSANSINLAFGKLNMSLRRYAVSSARAKKAYKNIIVDQVVRDKENAKNMVRADSEISFEHVDFGYGDKVVLKDFCLDIKKREKVGIVGLSGAGKSTLCNLLLRMYDVNRGAIKINGTDVRDVKQDSLRKNISYVPQDTTLFNRSILENIRYARPGASKADVINVAKKANIHDFIANLPNGYNTLVGNNGIKLSGGQRQRVSIARALLKDAPILVLDEATSALDSENEILIQKSLQYAMRGKTTIKIAHRLSTLRDMDRIIVIKDGQIVEQGSHNQLLRQKGVFWKLWKMQTSGVIN